MLLGMIALFLGATSVYVGFVDPDGGFLAVARSVVTGQPLNTPSLAERTAAKQAATVEQIHSLTGGGRTATTAADITPDDSASGSAVLDYAKTFLGTPYRFGGRTKAGFDCAGLVHFVALHFGHTTAWYVGGQLADTKTFARVKKADLQPGDVVFFGVHHVGFYAGNNSVLHAPHAGTVVRIEANMGNTPGPLVFGRIRGAATSAAGTVAT